MLHPVPLTVCAHSIEKPCSLRYRSRAFIYIFSLFTFHTAELTMRILLSLPRTHKILLLPVATMVTVLGVQKIHTVVEEVRTSQPLQETVLVPLSADSLPGVPSLRQYRDPIGEAIDIVTRAAPSSLAPLALAHQQDISLISAPAKQTDDAPDEAVAAANNTDVLSNTIDGKARDAAVAIADVTNDMPADSQEDIVPDATSYQEVSDKELALFGDGPITGPILLENEIDADKPFVPEWRTYHIKQGDAFAVVAQQHFGMGVSEAMSLLKTLPEPRLLSHWRADDRVDYQLDVHGQLIGLRIMKDIRNGYLIERDADSIEVATIKRAGEATQRLYAGTVSGSFTRSAQATGLNSVEVAELSRVLEKQLDFRRDSRRGDTFKVLVESDLVDGVSFDPRVLAVEYAGEKTDLTLVRNPEDNKFYTPDGQGLEQAFNRHPFEGNYRLSSNFNPKRLHPITRRISPHKGTDFAMPTGTSVLAPADGRVVKVGNHPGAGRYVEVLHDNGYKTRYLHLSRPLVSNNQQVKMGERIALSGNTGASTGPHLHYEVLVNNRQVNAMTVPLPENHSLSGKSLVAFKTQVEPLVAALESGRTGTVVAASITKGESDES